MSIYASTIVFDSEDHAEQCRRWVRCRCTSEHNHGRWMGGDRRHWYYDADARCTCSAGPLVYQGSHILPSDDDERDGCFDLAEIPPWITRDGTEGPMSGPLHPWLRVAIGEKSRVLDRGQVAEVAEYLNGWLRRTETDWEDVS